MSGYTAVNDVQEEFKDNLNYGVDYDGPVPENHSQMVCVPETLIDINEEQLAYINSAIAAI